MTSFWSTIRAILIFGAAEIVYAEYLRFTLQPNNNEAIEGKKTLLNCYVEGLQDGMTVSWMRDQTRISIGNAILDEQNKKRYSVEVDSSGKMHILYIDPVKTSDADHTYSCVVYKDDEKKLQSRSCTLEVKQVPSMQFPQCLTSKSSYIEHVDKATVTCITEDVVPEPKIVLLYENKQIKDPIKEKSKGHVTITYTFKIDRGFDGKSIVCSQTSSDLSSRNCSAGPLRVKYKPNVTIQGEIFHHVGKEELFVCSAKAKPAATMYIWTFEPYLSPDYYTIENNDQVLRIKIYDNLNGTKIRCEVYNPVGSNRQEKQIFIERDPPNPTITVQKVGALDKSNAGLGSSVDSTTMLSIAGSALMLTALLIGILLCYFQICKIQRNSLTVSGYGIAQPEVYFVPKDSIAPSVQNCDCNEWKRTVGIQVPTDLDIESVYMDIEEGKKTCSHKSV